jgi:hypothetical protein
MARVLAHTLTIPIEQFHGFHQSLQANDGMVSQFTHGYFFQDYFLFVSHPSLLCTTDIENVSK